MATLVLKDPFISIGGTDLSAHFTSVSIETSAEAPEDTAFGDDWRSRVAGGLKDWSLSMDFNQDFDAGALDATLWSLLATSVAVVLRTKAAAPYTQYSGSAILTSYPPLSNSVGEQATGSVSFEGAGELTRATA